MSENAESTPTATAQVWEAGHTALVHELWAARHEGLTLDDADTLARFLRRSRYQWATQELAAAGRPPVTFASQPPEHTMLQPAEEAAIAAAGVAEQAAWGAAAADIAESFGDTADVAAAAINQFVQWLATPRRARGA